MLSVYYYYYYYSDYFFLISSHAVLIKNSFCVNNFWHRNEFNVPPPLMHHTHTIIIVIDMSNYYSVKLFCVD